MSTSFTAFQSEIENRENELKLLKAQAEEARTAEAAEVIASIQAQIDKFGLSTRDFTSGKKKIKS